MIVRKADGLFSQETPAAIWTIPVPDGRMNVDVFGVYSADGRTSIEFDSVTFENGVLTIDFGLDAESGMARYEYDIETNSNTVEGDGGNITFTVNQYNAPK